KIKSTSSSPLLLKNHYKISFLHTTPNTQLYTLSLHDALPISRPRHGSRREPVAADRDDRAPHPGEVAVDVLHVQLRSARAEVLRSEEHTSELQSRRDLVCRLLLEKKKLYRDKGTDKTDMCHVI